MDIPAGAIISREMIGMKKPGTGISPAKLSDVVGKRMVRSVEANTVLAWDDVGEAQD